MKTIYIKGGLGNQMFQYARGRKLMQENINLIFDISFFNEEKTKKNTKRFFLIDNFNISNISSFGEAKSNKILIFIKKILLKFRLSSEEYFQSENFFIGIEDILRKEFTLKNESENYISAKSKISSNSLSIHIRHGDYVNDQKTNEYHGVLSIEYYKNAYDLIKQKTDIEQVVIFTDDPRWVKENFGFINKPIMYASDFNLSDPEELILMSKCSHIIIANSTFSWWGAWLNQNTKKIIVAPKQWTINKTSNKLGILPKSWIQL